MGDRRMGEAQVELSVRPCCLLLLEALSMPEQEHHTLECLALSPDIITWAFMPVECYFTLGVR